MNQIGHVNVWGVYMSWGVYVLRGKCPGVNVQGVSDRGICVLGGKCPGDKCPGGK